MVLTLNGPWNDSPSSEAQSAHADVAAPQNTNAKAAVGDPQNPATWKLPVEAFMTTKAEARLISNARDSLIDKCMEDAGFDRWTPAPDLPEPGGTTLVDWRYGIHDAETAAGRGYHPAAEQQQAYDEAMMAGAVDESGADEGKLRACVQAADGQAPPAQPAELVQRINGESFMQSKNDPNVVAALAKWSSCMKAKGYSYKEPMEANDDPRFNDQHKVTALEIATAKADIQCRDRYSVEKTWFDAEVKLQLKAIEENRPALEKVKARNKAAVAKASTIAK
ncbi:hypothetical protein ACQEVG_07075 [Streptomyces sp. CA-135486]|uniref:hypothetical protein n=1 Tax=Streptomyces sp. CA-135486 TaxID=3240049 RepID=UPI003D9208DC